MYYVLSCFGPEDQDRASIGRVPKFEGVNWLHGKMIEKRIPEPIEIELNPEFPGVMVPMFDPGILLFSDEMIAALRDAGVDNLQCFEATIHDPISGRDYCNYKAVNIIGLVSCADLAKSKCRVESGSPIIDVDFDSLVIDEKRTGRALMFRLAECVTAILVHEKVRQHLEARGIPYLDFIKPEEWVG